MWAPRAGGLGIEMAGFVMGVWCGLPWFWSWLCCQIGIVPWSSDDAYVGMSGCIVFHMMDRGLFDAAKLCYIMISILYIDIDSTA